MVEWNGLGAAWSSEREREGQPLATRLRCLAHLFGSLNQLQRPRQLAAFPRAESQRQQRGDPRQFVGEGALEGSLDRFSSELHGAAP